MSYTHKSKLQLCYLYDKYIKIKANILACYIKIQNKLQVQSFILYGSIFQIIDIIVTFRCLCHFEVLTLQIVYITVL